MRISLAPVLIAAALCAPNHAATNTKLSALIVDGVNNHDWAAATRAIQNILEGTGRFAVDVCTFPCAPNFARYNVVIDNFNSGFTPDSPRWPRATEDALERYVRSGGGLVVYHAANNAFHDWAAFNDMAGLLWRDPSFGPGLGIGPRDKVFLIPKGAGLPPGHGPRHDFEIFVRDANNPITSGLPAHWLHPSEQLTHGQHGPARGLTVLTYAFSEISRQGEPMDWIHNFGKGRVYVTMLGHTWKDEPNPNLDDVNFQALLARGTEWAATGTVTLPPDLGWKPLFNGKNFDGWESRGEGVWSVLPGGILAGERAHPHPSSPFETPWPIDAKQYRSWLYRQAWLYTKKEFDEFDLHLEYWAAPGSNSGVSIRDRSRAHHAIGEPDSLRPDLAGYPATTPAHIGYEIQIIDGTGEKYPSGSIYTFQAAKTGAEHRGEWNSMDILSRHNLITVRINGEVVAQHPGDTARSKTGPIGLQLHDQFTTILFRNIRIREISGGEPIIAGTPPASSRP
jgi:hypothetical protein